MNGETQRLPLLLGKTGSGGCRCFNEMQALGEWAGVKVANLKRFRSTLATPGKQRFGMSAEQVRAQRRHTTTETLKHCEKDESAHLRGAMKAVDFEGCWNEQTTGRGRLHGNGRSADLGSRLSGSYNSQ
jgi:hypothetical protein